MLDYNPNTTNPYDETDSRSEIIKYCPYCGALNHIQGCYAVGDTTGVIRCEYCRAEL